MTGSGARAVLPHDPRDRDDGLGWVARAVFPDERLRVTVGRRRWGPGVTSWAVVPSVSRARFLVPLGDPRVAAGSVLAFNSLRSGATRAVRTTLGGLARVGAAEALPFPVLSADGPAGAAAASSLIAHLAEVLGEPGLRAAIGVRPPDPNRKPTLQLFDGRGKPRGYAKIGWNEATRALVRAESAALRVLPDRPHDGYPVVPRLLHSGDWAGRAVSVTAPLPETVRRLPEPSRPRLAGLLAVARRGGPPGPLRTTAEAGLLDRFRRESATVPGAAGETIRRLVVRLAETVGGLRMEFGDWHGDWVPWNLGEVAERPGVARLVAWDWEHSGSGMPVGVDLVHQVFNTALVVARRPASRAVDAARATLWARMPDLGISPDAVESVVDIYLVEMWLRTFRLAAGGAGWNADLHPSLLEVLTRRMM
ncbi:hypothetical protein [Catenuloplanes indicus]|uniref:Aminoglycoside phosphotransferase domain-containing protein n=1 Tax=Catenuloplanes indicus TaxID=137267 RepID=A0AAE3W729_9ACTN|nr:hypothetical protein [Catenuloplanes indicus]MDQ0371063.1 hypothetical protein [Catenuloplanes indicus]